MLPVDQGRLEHELEQRTREQRLDLVPRASSGLAGAPASVTNPSQPNLSIRIPTRIDLGSGQFEVLTSFSQIPLTFDEAGPSDPSPTRDVVRAFRSGQLVGQASFTIIEDTRYAGPMPVYDVEYSPPLTAFRFSTLDQHTLRFTGTSSAQFNEGCCDRYLHTMTRTEH